MAQRVSKTARRLRRLRLEQLEPKRLLTSLQPELLIDLNPLPQNASSEMVEVNGTALFVSSSFESGQELYRLDRQTGSASILQDLNPGQASSYPEQMQVAPDGSYALFHGWLNDRRAVWYTDGESAKPVLLESAAVVFDRIQVLTLSEAGGYVARRLDDFGDPAVELRTEVWFVEAATGATEYIGEFSTDDDEGGVNGMAVRSDGLLLMEFCRSEELNCTLWGSDGTFHGTRAVFDGSGLSEGFLRVVEGELYYSNSSGVDLHFRYDGGNDFVPIPEPIAPVPQVGNQYGSIRGEGGELLFFTNDRPEVPLQVIDIGASTPNLLAVGDGLVAWHGSSIWGFDPRNSHVSLIHDAQQGGLRDIVSRQNEIYFSTAQRRGDGYHFEYRRSEGTLDSTEIIRELEGGQYQLNRVGDEIWATRRLDATVELKRLDGNAVSSSVSVRTVVTRGTYGLGLFELGDRAIVSGSPMTESRIAFAPDFETWSPIPIEDAMTYVSIAGDLSAKSLVVAKALDAASLDADEETIYITNRELSEYTDLADLVPEIDQYLGGVFLGAQFIFQDASSKLWVTDGTTDGTIKLYDLPVISPCEGDINANGTVDLADLNVIGLNWQQGVVGQRARSPRAALSVPIIDRGVRPASARAETQLSERPSPDSAVSMEACATDLVFDRWHVRRNAELYRRSSSVGVDSMDRNSTNGWPFELGDAVFSRFDD